MQDRVQKLLILAGQEGLELQSRDYKKVAESIIGYLKQKNTVFNQFFVNILSKVIKDIPLKYHMYAALTAEITIQFSNIATIVIEESLKNLQVELCRGDLYSIMNILQYLAELMSLSVFNSSTFMNILEDIVKAIESEKLDHPVRKILIIGLVRTLPIYAYSLNEKMPHEFRKYLDKLKKLVITSSEQEIFEKIYTDFTKSILKDNSWVQRIEFKFEPSFQYHNNMKLQLQLNGNAVTQVPQYFPITLEQDELYQSFVKSEGIVHRNNVQKLIHTFTTNSHLLVVKLLNYVKYFKKQNHYVLQYIIETLFGRALYDRLGLVECYIINAFCSEEQVGKDTKIIVNDILIYLYSQAQKFSLDILMEFSRVFSYLYNNSNLNWQWQPFLEPQSPMIQRQILLRITFERIALLNDKKDLTEFNKYVPSDRKKLTEYNTVQDMEIFEAFTNKLATKSQSDVIIPMIISEHTFEIFLQTLFRKTCLSQTHLQVLLDRYAQVFKTYEQYDWVLIGKIRRFWRKSFFNRILYIKEIIKRQFCSFESYVNYISKVALEGAEAVQLKLQLNQINKSYKKMSNKV